MVWSHRTNRYQWLDSLKKVMSVQMQTKLETLLNLYVTVSLSEHLFHKLMCLKERRGNTEMGTDMHRSSKLLLLIKMNPPQRHRKYSIKIIVMCLFSRPIYNTKRPRKGSTLNIST